MVGEGDGCACKRETQGIPVMELFCYLDVMCWWWFEFTHDRLHRNTRTHTNEYIVNLVKS